jgi:hypothetical protein
MDFKTYRISWCASYYMQVVTYIFFEIKSHTELNSILK